MRKLARWMVFLVPAVCVAQQPEKPPVAEPAAPEQPARVEEPEAPVVTLIDAGAEPRQTLRLKPVPGAVQAVRLRVVMGLSMSVEGLSDFSMPAMPAMLLTLTMKATEISAEGDARYDIAFGSCAVEAGTDVSSDTVEMMRAAIAPLGGVTGSGLMTARGIVKDLKLKPPANMDPASRGVFDNMKQQASQVGAPLPEEAVGVGARWSVKTKVLSDGLVIDQVETFELVSVKDGLARLKMELEQSTAAGQKMKAPGMAEDAAVALDSFRSSGAGELEQSLTSLVPRTANTRVVTNLAAKLAVEGQPRKMTQKVTIQVSMSPAEGAELPADVPSK